MDRMEYKANLERLGHASMHVRTGAFCWPKEEDDSERSMASSLSMSHSTHTSSTRKKRYSTDMTSALVDHSELQELEDVSYHLEEGGRRDNEDIKTDNNSSYHVKQFLKDRVDTFSRNIDFLTGQRPGTFTRNVEVLTGRR